MARMKVEALTLIGLPYAIKGVSTFRMQYNPSILEDSASTANYAEHRGLGSQIPTYHYLYTETGPITIPVVITDSYDGPPHSTRDPFGNIVQNDFENLFSVVNWFKDLTHSVSDWKKPPFCRISLGKWNRFGIIEEISKTRIVRMYKNGDPEIIEFSFTLKPNVMTTVDDQAFFEVD